MQLPREVIVGRGTLNRIPEVLNRLKITGKALIIAGKTSYEIAGEKVRDLLSQTGMSVDTFLVKKVTTKEVLMVEKQIQSWNPSVVLAVGGGTKIDAAKLGSSCQGIPFISIPTTLSHDGIASPLASVKGSGKPYSIMAQAPLAIIADIDIIATITMEVSNKWLWRCNIKIYCSKRLVASTYRKRRILWRICG